MCPSDTYKVYKQGSNVRIDTTLLGFDQSSWQRGNKSYLFKAESNFYSIFLKCFIKIKKKELKKKTNQIITLEAPQLLWGKRSYIYKLASNRGNIEACRWS